MNPKHEELKRLEKEWYQKLRDEGFQDIELRCGALKDIDRRSNSFENRTQIEAFYTKIEHFLNEDRPLPDHERDILGLYVQGIFITRIEQILSLKRWKVKTVITKYKRLLKYD